ncbi:uncharacterized protein, partial [Littorina saxatilis]|uniref:uncharacterized protein n=1 Tax=Littorina saxatilis TaxID=31220 RepID=UPI0038B652F4
MALLSTSLNQVIICVFILCGVQPSLQDVCPTSFLFTDIDEGPDTKGHVLFVANLTELSLGSDDNGYLAVNETRGNGFKTFTLYIAKEVDYEERTGIVGRIFCGDSS